tara:strand:- start:20914 stop:21414 length:501 start_codon:yes stop_codon:yes gene_type:complete
MLSFACEKKPKKKNKSKKENIEPTISNFEVEDYFYKNVKVDEKTFVDKILINKKGIFLIYNDEKLRKTITGDFNDEYLMVKNKKIPNPLLLKEGTKKKVKTWINKEDLKIETVILSKKIKTNNNELNIFKNEKDFDKEIKSRENVYNKDQMFEINEKLIFLDKRRK